jgi:hypothetical protein
VHRDHLACCCQGVVVDLLQSVLLIRYEIVYETYWTASGRCVNPCFSGEARLLVTRVICDVQY